MAYARACFTWGKRCAKVPENHFADLPISASTTERERVLSDTEIAEAWAAAAWLAYPDSTRVAEDARARPAIGGPSSRGRGFPGKRRPLQRS
jgi:hypothetical protein